VADSSPRATEVNRTMSRPKHAYLVMWKSGFMVKTSAMVFVSLL